MPDLEPAARKRERNRRVTAKIAELRKYYAGLDNYKGLTRAVVVTANKKFMKGHAEFFDGLFEYTPLTAGHKKAMLELTHDALLKDEWTDSISSMVFVGFGTTEPYARAIRLNTQGIYAGKLVGTTADRKPIDAKNKHPKVDAYLIAQDDAMQTFFTGYHPQTNERVSQAVLEHLGDKINEPAVKGSVEDAVKHAVEVGLNRVGDDQAQPVWDSLKFRSVSDLADFAEAMLKIQTLSSRMRGDATAGGQIELVSLTA